MISTESERRKGLLGLAVTFCVALLFLLLVQPAQTLASTGTSGSSTGTSDVTSGSTLTTGVTSGSTLTTNVTSSSTLSTDQTTGVTLTQAGGAITGTVTDTAGNPIAGAAITVDDIYYNQVASGTTDANGNYTITGLASGNYSVVASAYDLGYIQDVYTGTVAVTDGQTVTGIDFTLQLGGGITGTVRDTNGIPVAGVVVAVCDSNSNVVANATTGVDGNYGISGLSEGLYTIQFQFPYNSACISELYQGNPVTVNQGSTVSGIDATMAVGGEITGVVTDANGQPLAGVDVYANSGEGVSISTTTGSDGTYTFSNLMQDVYTLQFDPSNFNQQNNTYYLSQYYNNQPSLDLADPISVAFGQSINNVNAQLQTGGQISGTVTLPDGSPAGGIYVIAKGSNNPWITVTTQADGSYVIPGLMSGNYILQIDPEYFNYLNGTNYPTFYYNDQATISITPGQTISGINAQLQEAGQISGTVTLPDGSPAGGVSVTAYAADGSSITANTQADGTYVISPLATGNYTVQFNPDSYNSNNGTDYFATYYNNNAEVSVTQGQTTGGIDFQLQLGGEITGTLTDTNGIPVADEYLDLYDNNDNLVTSGATDSNGAFTISAVAPGTYKLRFTVYDGYTPNYSWYNGQTDFYSATPIIVNSGEALSIAAVVPIGGGNSLGSSISGVVTDAAGNPLQNVEVRGYGQNTGYAFTAYTGPDGSYTMDGLNPDSYIIEFNPYTINQQNGTSYLDQYYNNQQSYSAANQVTVVDQQSVTGIDAVLQIGGSISGIVTGPDGTPVPNVHVTADGSLDGAHSGYADTAADGSYTITGLAADDYVVEFDATNANEQAGTNYAWQYYANALNYNQASKVKVTLGQTVSDINAVLQPGSTISGTVTDTNGNPLANVDISVSGDFYAYATTDVNGQYSVTGLAPGTYSVMFDTSNLNYQEGTDYLPQYYPNLTYYNWNSQITLGEAQTLNNIDAKLQLGGSISGTVTDSNGNPLSGVEVYATVPNGLGMGMSQAYTDANGNYIINSLVPDTYEVDFSSDQYIAQTYNGKPDSHSYDPVVVLQGQTTANIDATLQLGGSISGTVTDLNGNPIVGLSVRAGGGFAQTNSDGTYTIAGLATGSYTVAFGDWQYNAYDNLNYQAYQSPSSIQVTEGQAISGIDAQLAPGGSISGTVTDAAGSPLAGIIVNINGQTWSFQVRTDAAGHYQAVGLPAGFYKVMFDGYGYAKQWYNGTTQDLASGIQIASGQTVTNINSQLIKGGSITGVVTDSNGKPISGISVEVYGASSNGEEYSSIDGTVTDADGNYELDNLDPGQYKVLFGTIFGITYNPTNYMQTWYGNQSDFAGAALVTVTDGQSTGNIDAQLQTGGTISGTVTDSNGQPAAGIEVDAYSATAGDPLNGGGGDSGQFAYTDSNGHYSLVGLSEGSYKLRFTINQYNQIGQNYAPQWSGGQSTFDTATAIAVVPGQGVNNIDAQMQTGGSISGTIVDANGTPVANITVSVNDQNGNYIGSMTNSDAYGHYTINRLATGNYKVLFQFDGYQQAYDQWYGNKNTMDDANLVSVTVGQTVSNINAQLSSGGFISGVVTDGANNPVANVCVNVYDQNGHDVDVTWTDGFGAYTLPVAAGTYQVKVDEAQFTDFMAVASGLLTVANGQTVNADLNLLFGTKLSGKVYGDANTPLSGVEIDVYDANNNLVTSTQSSAGYYYLNLQPGTYKLQVKAGGYNATHNTNYSDVWYNNQTDISTATPIVVVQGQPQAGLNINLNSTVQITATKGTLDNPAPNQELTGVTNVSGWFLDQAGVAKLEVLVDNQVVGQAVYGDPRPDVAAAFPDYNNPNAGFHYSLDTTAFADGLHILTLKETSANGQVTTLPAVAFTSHNLPAKAALDTPASGATLSGTANVSGWLIDGIGVSKVEVLIDGNVVGEASYGDPRPDVASAFPAYNNPNSGFHYSLDTTGLSVGSHTLAIQETASDGSQQIVATQDFSVAAAAKGNLDDITDGTNVGGTLNLHGWYLDQSGVAKIQVVVDGNVLGEAAYGDARPDVAAAYPEFNNPNSGYHYSLDTTTLTAGSHSLVIREISNDGTSRDLPARTINVTLPDKGFLDGVDNGSTLSGTVNLSGWYLSGTSVAKVEVLVDGNVVGQASYGDARPDVYAAFPAYNNQNSGYHFSLNTTTLAAGSHTLTLRETGTDGSSNDFAVRTFSVAAARRGTVDDLDDGASLSGTYDLYGWYLDSAGVAEIQILVDGNVVGQASYGDARPDVYAAFPDYNNQNAGYHYDLDTSSLSAGTHSLVIREISMDGSQNDLTARTFTTSLPPKGTIDGITDGMTVSGTYNVSGWFLDANTVQTVDVLVDGQVVGTATYGDARPDVAAAFPEYNNQNSGFHYSLDTSLLSAGSHTLTVRETSVTGAEVTLPEHTIVVG